VYPRINPLESGRAHIDLKKLVTKATIPFIDGLMIPKINNANEAKELEKMLKAIEKDVGVTENSIPIIGQFETAESII